MFLKDIQFLPIEECITQHNPLLCNFNIRKVPDNRGNVAPGRKTWQLHVDNAKSGFSSYIKKCRESNQKMLQTVAVDGQKIQVDIGKNESGMMLVLVLVRSVNYGRSGKISRRKKKAGTADYQTICKAERKRFGNAMQRDDQTCDGQN